MTDYRELYRNRQAVGERISDLAGSTASGGAAVAGDHGPERLHSTGRGVTLPATAGFVAAAENTNGGIQIFTPGQTSDMLDIPPSTLRRYARDFAEQLSEHANKSRGRRYTAADIAMLKRARALLSKGRSPEEVAALLGVVEAEGGERESADIFALAVPEAAEAIRALDDKADGLRLDLDDAKRIIAAELIRQRNEQQAAAEAMREWAELPWWRRMFTAPDVPEPSDTAERAARLLADSQSDGE